jgi:hypothetical protein
MEQLRAEHNQLEKQLKDKKKFYEDEAESISTEAVSNIEVLKLFGFSKSN